MNHSMKRRYLAAVLLLGAVINTPAMALGFLDDMIYSVKCAAADDVEACKAQAQQKFEDYNRQRQGAGGSPTPSGTDDSGWQKLPQQCYTVNASGPGNIDYAYASIIDQFGFMTLEEKAAWLKQRAGRMKDDGFKHRAVPGYLYDMRDTVFNYKAPDGKGIVMFAGAKLKKTKAGGTSIDAEYCLVGVEMSYSNAVAESFKNVVR